MATRTRQEAQDHLLSSADERLRSLAEQIQAGAIASSLTVATAESCTGGLIGHSITEVPGSSGYYRGGVISYADELKEGLLDVPAETIRNHGAVSAQVAVAMAEGARARAGADYAVAVTGVAGPDGGTPDKPVGLTYIAMAGPDGNEVRRHVWDGDRSANKASSAEAALDLLVTSLELGRRAGE